MGLLSITDELRVKLLANLDVKITHQRLNAKREKPIPYLRPKQVDCLIRSIDADGNTQDMLAILPTGYGKSLLFELLPLYCELKRKRTCKVLIASPLNAIIQQQKSLFGDSARIMHRIKDYSNVVEEPDSVDERLDLN